MIVIKLQGGLGNQMFQYAFGISVSQKLKSRLYFDLSFYTLTDNGLTQRNFELGLFAGSVNIAGDSLKNSFFGKSLYSRIVHKLGISKKTVYREQTLKFSSDVFNVKPPVYFEGFWQSEQYFNDNEDLIRKSLVFKNPLNPDSQKIAELIAKQGNPVSVHIRRGDYVSSKSTNELHGVCSAKYYMDAITEIKDKTPDPYFYFFSDDPDWVKETLLPVIENAVLVQHNKDSESWQDMALMSKCKHHIIANSSFSWWGAWLNANKEKIVIAPVNWFSTKTDNLDPQDLIPGNWIQLPNE
jgi:hypothetical protein